MLKEEEIKTQIIIHKMDFIKVNYIYMMKNL